MKVKDRLFMSYGKVDVENEKSSFLSSPKRNLKKCLLSTKIGPASPVSAKGEQRSPFFVEQSADLQQVGVFNIVKIANCSRFLEEKKRSPFSESVRAFCVHHLD